MFTAPVTGSYRETRESVPYHSQGAFTVLNGEKGYFFELGTEPRTAVRRVRVADTLCCCTVSFTLAQHLFCFYDDDFGVQFSSVIHENYRHYV